jgi:hypothetical protein
VPLKALVRRADTRRTSYYRFPVKTVSGLRMVVRFASLLRWSAKGKHLCHLLVCASQPFQVYARQMPLGGGTKVRRSASDVSNPWERWRDGRAIAVAVPVVVAGVRASHTPEEPERASKSGRIMNLHLLCIGPAQDAQQQSQGFEGCRGSSSRLLWWQRSLCSLSVIYV